MLDDQTMTRHAAEDEEAPTRSPLADLVSLAEQDAAGARTKAKAIRRLKSAVDGIWGLNVAFIDEDEVRAIGQYLAAVGEEMQAF